MGLSGCEDFTPKEFGNYIVDGKKLSLLQKLKGATFRSGHQTYSESPNAIVHLFRGEVKLVLFHRHWSISAPSTFFAYILAKERNAEHWVLLDLGYDLSVKPDATNRDIIEVTNRGTLPFGRYAIRTPEGLFSFGVLVGQAPPPGVRLPSFHCVMEPGGKYEYEKAVSIPPC